MLGSRASSGGQGLPTRGHHQLAAKVKGLGQCMKAVLPFEAKKLTIGDSTIDHFSSALLHELYAARGEKDGPSQHWRQKHVKPLLRIVEYLRYTSVLTSKEAHGAREAIIKMYEDMAKRPARRKKRAKKEKNEEQKRISQLETTFDLQGELMKHASAWYTNQLHNSIQSASPSKSQRIKAGAKRQSHSLPQEEQQKNTHDLLSNEQEKPKRNKKKRRYKKRRRKKKRKKKKPVRPAWNFDTKSNDGIPDLSNEPSVIFSEASRSTYASSDPWIRKNLKNPYLDGQEDYFRLGTPPPPEVGVVLQASVLPLLHPSASEPGGVMERASPETNSHSRSTTVLPQVEKKYKKSQKGMQSSSLYNSNYGPYSTQIEHKSWNMQGRYPMVKEKRVRSIFLERISPKKAEIQKLKRIKAYGEVIAVRNKALFQTRTERKNVEFVEQIAEENARERNERICRGLDILENVLLGKRKLKWFADSRIYFRIREARRRKAAISCFFRCKKKVVQEHSMQIWFNEVAARRQIKACRARRQKFHAHEAARKSMQIARARKRARLQRMLSLSAIGVHRQVFDKWRYLTKAHRRRTKFLAHEAKRKSQLAHRIALADKARRRLGSTNAP